MKIVADSGNEIHTIQKTIKISNNVPNPAQNDPFFS